MKADTQFRVVLPASIAATLVAGIILATLTLGSFQADAQAGAIVWPVGGLTPAMIAIGSLLLLAAELGHASRIRVRNRRVDEIVRAGTPRAGLDARPLH